MKQINCWVVWHVVSSIQLHSGHAVEGEALMPFGMLELAILEELK